MLAVQRQASGQLCRPASANRLALPSASPGGWLRRLSGRWPSIQAGRQPRQAQVAFAITAQGHPPRVLAFLGDQHVGTGDRLDARLRRLVNWTSANRLLRSVTSANSRLSSGPRQQVGLLGLLRVRLSGLAGTRMVSPPARTRWTEMPKRELTCRTRLSARAPVLTEVRAGVGSAGMPGQGSEGRGVAQGLTGGTAPDSAGGRRARSLDSGRAMGCTQPAGSGDAAAQVQTLTHRAAAAVICRPCSAGPRCQCRSPGTKPYFGWRACTSCM